MTKTLVPSSASESFGERLVRLRRQAGYTQKELGEELGISQRMVAYYEGQTEHPPTKLMPLLAKATTWVNTTAGEALGVSADELLGLKSSKRTEKPAGRLARRLKAIESLPAADKRQVVQFIDALLERDKLRHRRTG